MKKLLIIICLLTFMGCTTDNTSNITSNIDKEIDSNSKNTNKATSYYTSSEFDISTLKVPEGQCLPNPMENSLDINLDLLKKQILIDNYFNQNPPYPYYDNAYFKFCDINADGYTDLIWSQQGYRYCDVNIYSFKDMKIESICKQIIGTSTFFKNYKQDKFVLHRISEDYLVLETNYYDEDGFDDWATFYRYKRFFGISNTGIKLIADPMYCWFGEGNPEFQEECYLSADGERDMAISVEEFNKYVMSLTEGAISSEEFVLNNFIENYMDGTKLSDALVKAYQEYNNNLNI